MFDINPFTEDEHEAILQSVGTAHSFMWLSSRIGGFLTKIGEAFNETPIFIFDKTVEEG